MYGAYGGVIYVGCQIAYELEFKLSTLIDKSFENVEDLKSKVLNLINIHYEPYVLKPQNSLAQHIIDKTNQEFLSFLEEVFIKKDSLAAADIPYRRVTIGTDCGSSQNTSIQLW